MEKAIALETFGGTRYFPVEIVGETAARYRVEVTNRGGVMLPGRRYVAAGEITLVPKHGVCDMPPGKAEGDYYDGHVYAYGTKAPDAKKDVKPSADPVMSVLLPPQKHIRSSIKVIEQQRLVEVIDQVSVNSGKPK